jgi:sugar/nucleoside kinase (ribokinase family)
VIKLGYRGLYLRTGDLKAIESMGRAKPSNVNSWANKEFWAPVFKVNAVGTTGSGDSTIAGFLSAMLRDLEPEQAVVAATAAGAHNVEAADSLSGLRSWEEMMARVANGWERRPLEIDAPDWHFNTSQQLWIRPNSR